METRRDEGKDWFSRAGMDNREGGWDGKLLTDILEFLECLLRGCFLGFMVENQILKMVRKRE